MKSVRAGLQEHDKLKMSLSNASSQTLSAPASPVAGGLALPTPPGSPRPDTGPAPRQETWSIAYGNPPPWMAPVPLTRSNALRIYTAGAGGVGEEMPPEYPRISVPRAGDSVHSVWGRPQFMEPLTTGSSAVSSPVDRGFTGDHIGGIILADYYPGLMPLPSPPAEPFVPQERTVLPPSTPVPVEQD